MRADVDPDEGVVRRGDERWPFDVDPLTGAAVVELDGRGYRVHPLLWREKLVLARYSRLGLPFVQRLFLRAVLADGQVPPGDERAVAALEALALWVNDPTPAGEALPLDAALLATVVLDLCRAAGLKPADLDARPAAEVELLWQVARAAGGIEAPARSPADQAEGTRILVVPDQPPREAPPDALEAAVVPEPVIVPEAAEAPTPGTAPAVPTVPTQEVSARGPTDGFSTATSAIDTGLGTPESRPPDIARFAASAPDRRPPQEGPSPRSTEPRPGIGRFRVFAPEAGAPGTAARIEQTGGVGRSVLAPLGVTHHPAGNGHGSPASASEGPIDRPDAVFAEGIGALPDAILTLAGGSARQAAIAPALGERQPVRASVAASFWSEPDASRDADEREAWFEELSERLAQAAADLGIDAEG